MAPTSSPSETFFSPKDGDFSVGQGTFGDGPGFVDNEFLHNYKKPDTLVRSLTYKNTEIQNIHVIQPRKGDKRDHFLCVACGGVHPDMQHFTKADETGNSGCKLVWFYSWIQDKLVIYQIFLGMDVTNELCPNIQPEVRNTSSQFKGVQERSDMYYKDLIDQEVRDMTSPLWIYLLRCSDELWKLEASDKRDFMLNDKILTDPYVPKSKSNDKVSLLDLILRFDEKYRWLPVKTDAAWRAREFAKVHHTKFPVNVYCKTTSQFRDILPTKAEKLRSFLFNELGMLPSDCDTVVASYESLPPKPPSSALRTKAPRKWNAGEKWASTTGNVTLNAASSSSSEDDEVEVVQVISPPEVKVKTESDLKPAATSTVPVTPEVAAKPTLPPGVATGGQWFLINGTYMYSEPSPASTPPSTAAASASTPTSDNAPSAKRKLQVNLAEVKNPIFPQKKNKKKKNVPGK